MKITTARTVPVVVLVAILAVLLLGTDLVRARQGAAPAEHRAVLNSDLGWINLRQCTKATCVVLDQPDNGTVVTVRCWIRGQIADPDGHPGLDRWYLVTKIDGRYVGSSGYVYAALLNTPPEGLPGCHKREGMTEIGTRYPLIPEAGHAVTLARGPAAPEGYWYAITVRGLRPHTTFEVRCFDSEDNTPTDFLPDKRGFRRYPIRTDANGNAYSERGCYSAVNGKHTVSVDDWYSNSVLWGASPSKDPALTNAPRAPTVAPRTPGLGGEDSPVVRLAKGPAAPKGYRYAITLRGFPAISMINITCYDSVSSAGFHRFSLRTDSEGGASTTSQCYSGDGPDHWVAANGVESNHVTWSGESKVSVPLPSPAPPPPPPPSPAVYLAQGPAARAGYRYAITLDAFTPHTSVTLTCHDSVDPDGFYAFSLRTDGNGHAFTQSYCYSGDYPDHWVRANGVESNHVHW